MPGRRRLTTLLYAFQREPRDVLSLFTSLPPPVRRRSALHPLSFSFDVAPFARLSLALVLRPPICFSSALSFSLFLFLFLFIPFVSISTRAAAPLTTTGPALLLVFSSFRLFVFLRVEDLSPCRAVTCRRASTTSEKNGTGEETNHNAISCLTLPFVHSLHCFCLLPSPLLLHLPSRLLFFQRLRRNQNDPPSSSASVPPGSFFFFFFFFFLFRRHRIIRAR